MVEKRERRRRDGSTYAVWRVRWCDETGAERSKTFDRAADARAFEAKIRTLKRTRRARRPRRRHARRSPSSSRSGGTVYAGPNLERATLRAYAQLWNGHALPRLGHLQLRELTPQTIARFRAELEAAGVGIEAIRKTMTMLQGVLQRAVEWGRVPTNAVKLTRKPPKPHRPAVQAIPPSLIEVMRARLLDRRPAARRDAAGRARLRRAAAAGGARARVASRARAHAAGRARAQRRAAQGAQEPSPAADGRAARAAARGPRRVARSAQAQPAPTRAGVPVARRRRSGARRTGATGASGSTSRSPRRSASTARGRTTCATRSRRC